MLKRALLIALLCAPATAGERTLDWPDLIPPVAPMADPLLGVDMALRYDLGFVAQVMRDADSGAISRQGPEFLNAMAMMERLRAEHADADRLLRALTAQDAEISRRNKATDPALDGQTVRLPGYALPLEIGGEGVTEFLLVPYVGACIHVPPPPPNQIVHARLAEPYEMEGLYTPVWITGRLSTAATRPALSYVDGSANIATGYQMEVTAVEPYD